MRVLDGAVALLDANQGVEPQTETVWRQADKYGVPRMIFVNKMDKIGADFFLSVQMIKDRLGAKPIVIQLPLGAESNFTGVIDLVKMKAIVWDDESPRRQVPRGGDPRRPPGAAKEYHDKLIETAVEIDEAAMEAYLEGKEPDTDKLKALIRKGTVNDQFVPGLVRLGLQEQRRTAAARRGGRLPPVAARRAADQGHRFQDRRRGRTRCRPTPRRSPCSPSRS